jgi:hypothetical protein
MLLLGKRTIALCAQGFFPAGTHGCQSGFPPRAITSGADSRRQITKERKIMKKFVVLLILSTLCCALFGEEFEGIVYRLEGPRGPRQRAIITGYIGGSKAVEVKDKIQGVLVNRIAAGAYARQGLISADIPGGLDENGLVVENGAFTGNSIRTIIIGNNVSLQPQAFDNNFAAYYNNRGKRSGVFMWNGTLSVWQTESEYSAWEKSNQTVLEEARRRAETEEARRREAEEARKREAAEARRREAEEARKREAEEARRKEEEARRREAESQRTQPQYTPSYSSYTYFDAGIQSFVGYYINAGYIDGFSIGVAFQLGFGMDIDDIQLNFLGQGEGAFSFTKVIAYGYGGIGELFFDDEWGLGFGAGYADAYNIEGKPYFRGALLVRGDEFSKAGFYADYFTNSNWRFGVNIFLSLSDSYY